LIHPMRENIPGELRDDRLALPKGFVHRVIGLTPANNVINALQEFGFSSFVQVEDGFDASI